MIGISTISLVASPLILTDKKRQPTNTGEAKQTLTRMGVRVADENSVTGMRFADANPTEQEQEVEDRIRQTLSAIPVPKMPHLPIYFVGNKPVTPTYWMFRACRAFSLP